MQYLFWHKTEKASQHFQKGIIIPKQNIIGHVTHLKQQREYLLSICFTESELLLGKFKKERGYTGDEVGAPKSKGANSNVSFT
jgi:hypothetical protein